MHFKALVFLFSFPLNSLSYDNAAVLSCGRVVSFIVYLMFLLNSSKLSVATTKRSICPLNSKLIQ